MKTRLKRAPAVILGVIPVAYGALMLVGGRRWYETTPNVADAGPFNPEFAANAGAGHSIAGRKAS